jgi:hypothetical protein
MSNDVEELLRDGMERFTAGVHAPPGLARTAGRLHRRRLAIRTAVACGAAVATATAAIAVTGVANSVPARTADGGVRTVAYVVRRVENALAGQKLVYRGQTIANDGTPSTTWVYGARSQWVEFGTGGRPYSAAGTALIGGRRFSVYLIYPDRKWMGSPGWGSTPASACSATGALSMGGIPVPAAHWANFIDQTLACGAAAVTGHVLVDGVETTKITGRPITVKLSPGYARTVHEKWARARWTLYVDPRTYLPVRITGSTATFGGPGAATLYSTVTNVRWLPPTTANIAHTLVTVPAGFQRVSSASNV